METEKTNGNGQTNIPREPPKHAVATLDALLATAKNDADKKEILGNVGKGLIRRITEAQSRLANAVLIGDFESARQRYADIEEMEALGWHICKSPILVSGLAAKLLAAVIEAFKTGNVEVGTITPESPASRHGVSFF